MHGVLENTFSGSPGAGQGGGGYWYVSRGVLFLGDIGCLSSWNIFIEMSHTNRAMLCGNFVVFVVVVVVPVVIYLVYPLHAV